MSEQSKNMSKTNNECNLATSETTDAWTLSVFNVYKSNSNQTRRGFKALISSLDMCFSIQGSMIRESFFQLVNNINKEYINKTK